MGTGLSTGAGEGSGFVGTVGAAAHGSRVEPDVGQMGDQVLSARVAGVQVPPHLTLQPVSRRCTVRFCTERHACLNSAQYRSNHSAGCLFG